MMLQGLYDDENDDNNRGAQERIAVQCKQYQSRGYNLSTTKKAIGPTRQRQ